MDEQKIGGIDFETNQEEADNYLIAATRSNMHMLDLFSE